MKTGILMGRGIEGCGVTKCVIEFCKSQPSSVFATIDKKWHRKNAHGSIGASEFLASDPAQRESVVRALNEMDAVIVYSLPSKDNHPKECQDGFLDMLRSIKAKKAMIHLDHSYKSLHNNANLADVLREMDVVMTHSANGSLARFVMKEGINVPVRPVGLGFDFDDHRSKYWKPIGLQDSKTLRWIGRTARWKGPQLVLDFHDAKLRGLGFRTILEGLEASINYVITLYHDEHEKKQPRDVINKFRSWGPGIPKDNDIRHGEELHGGPAVLYPPYENAECMERLSTSAFGSDLYVLPENMYGMSIENCHGEVVASGTVPVFNKHFGDNVLHRVTGDPFTKSENSGTLFLGSDNFDEVSDKMVALASDPVLRDETREMAFEFWKSHASSDMIVADIMRVVRDVEAESNIEDFFG